MRVVFLVVVLGCWVPALSAQGKGSRKLSLNTDWATGTKLELVFEKERIESGPASGKSRIPVTVEILAGSAKGYDIAWQYGRGEVLGSHRGEESFERLVNLWEGCRLRLRTDAYGRVKGLANPGEVLAAVERRKRSLIRWFNDQGFGAKVRKELRKALDAACDREPMIPALLKVPTLFFLPSGRTFEGSKRQIYQDLLPNSWGGDPFPCRAQLHLASIDPTKRRATVAWKRTLDVKKAKAIARKTVAKIWLRRGYEVKSWKKAPRFEIKEKADYCYDTETGFPVSVRYQRTTRAASEKWVDRMTITARP